MKISIKQMIDDYYDGNREAAAKAAGINTVYQLNNLVSEGKQVARLDNGDWIMLTKKSKIFKKPNNI
ncbi:hypothetical protein [Vibrio coralliilyticus]|uniref:Uncharacterized protein n=1 Tax=Vibrio coralliilyticus TaxID=190893 RepID=A0AAP7DFT5_9VIBR|nr:hypothetical protein [Vibrio coralliilyticus]NOI32036.1 hypothetical protein [Vibrio coralliilyticus]NOJ25237.1 hypothetical protein [Vibrio coralliilyticus]